MQHLGLPAARSELGNRAVRAHLPPGARLEEHFISAERGEALLEAIDAEPWLGDLARRVQHYGWRYDYRARKVTSSMALGALPDWSEPECLRISALAGFDRPPDQIIVNEYLPGQGISAHVDCVPCFGPAIASLSLGSPVGMIFRHRHTGQNCHVVLPPLSLLVLTDDARHTWTHEIPARKTDMIAGCKVSRGRRVSLTFRTVLHG